MSAITWSDQQKSRIYKLSDEGLSSVEIARQFPGKTPGSIRGVIRRRGHDQAAPQKKEKETVVNSTIAEDREKTRSRLAQETAAAALRKYNELLQKQELDDQVVEVFSQQLQESFGSTLNINIRQHPKVYRGQSLDEEAVLVLSDTHVGKIVEANETNGFGYYNPLRYLTKLQHLTDKVAHIINERNGYKHGNPIRRLHIMLLGDLVDGMLNHAEEIPGHTYVSQQVQLAALSLFQSIARLSLVVDEVKVYGLGGNHARWPNQKKPPTTGRFSNLDTIVLEWIQSLFEISPIKNVSFQLTRSLHQIVDILGFRFCTAHGDHLKGGDKAMGVPIHAIAREINSMTQRLAARHEKVPRYYIVGDKHKRIELPTARGAFMVNGAFPGTDGYSLSGGFSETLPEQLFFGVHPVFGKSWTYNMNISDEMVPDMPLNKLSFNLPAPVLEDLKRFDICPG